MMNMSAVPATIGRFQIDSLLGRGSMGEVYKAWDPTLERYTALKLIDATLGAKEWMDERFLREAKAASKLRHPNIVTVYDIGDFDGRLFITMEYVPGEDLQRVIQRRHPLSYEQKLDIMYQLAEGVDAAHRSGIIHRDLKPSNVLLDQDERIKIVDFGLARIGVSELTAPGTILGTPHYMSPEQLQGISQDERTDIFALGAIFYELLTGKKAFSGHDVAAVFYKIITENPAPLSAFLSGPVDKLDQIIRSCLEKDRNNRMKSCSALARSIRGISAPDLSTLGTVQLTPDTPDREEVPNNLPSRKSTFIGRESELSSVEELLKRPDVELVTLTGPGGTGKTQLALKIARNLLGHFPDGVFFVALESIRDPQLVIPFICQTLDLAEPGGRTMLEGLIKHFREKNRSGMLLILDNFEQVIDSATDIYRIISSRTGVKFLITSRERLNISEEHEYPVRPLAVPANERMAVDSILSIPAVRLFQERAKLSKPDFHIRAEDAATILEICRKVDGLPLAIELVAARIKFLTPDQMLRKLENSLQFLTAGPKDLPERLRSLHGAISWSYELLSESSRLLFESLSVFRGSFSLEAAEAVCANSVDDVLMELFSLADKNLLLSDEENGETKFRMLNTLQEYAYSRLKENPGYVSIRNKHAAHFLRIAEAGAILLSAVDGAALKRLDRHIDNFRFALQWYMETENWELAASLALALWRFWEARSYRTEGRENLAVLLNRGDAYLPLRTKTRLLYAAGILSESQGDYFSARAYFEKNLEINTSLQDNAGGIANSLNNVAVVAERQGDTQTAEKFYTGALERWKQLGNQTAVGLAWMNLGSIAFAQKDYARAMGMYEESLAIWKKLSDIRGKALVLNLMGDIALDQQQMEQAFEFYQEGLHSFEEITDERGVALALENLAVLLCYDHDFEQAQTLLSEALVLRRNQGDQRGLARTLECFALLKMQQGNFETAAALGGAATALRDSIRAAKTPTEKQRFDQIMTAAREKSGNVVFAQQWFRGMSLPLENVIREALAS